MAERNKNEMRLDKSSKSRPSALLKIGLVFVKLGKRLKSFFINLKAELKRVIWPDRKRLIQNTATVLAICVAAGVILFIVDSILGGVLEGVGFYATSSTTAATTTVATTSESIETTATTIEVTTEAAAG